MKRKWLGTLVALALVLCIAGGATLAFLMVTTPSLTNVFQYGHVTCAVDETFQNNVKSKVSIRNTGDTEAYIRVKLVFTWKDANGNVSAQPVTAADYDLKLSMDGWFEKDGYYYAKAPVAPIAPDNKTPVLIEKCTEVTANAPDGYTLSLEILADAIQSTPAKAVQDAWKTVTVGDDRLLTVKEVQG